MTNAFYQKIPNEYIPQVQGGMFVTGAKWWDFGSFDPRLPDPVKLIVVRIERDNEYIVKLEKEIILFNAEVEKMIERLMQ